MSPHSRQTAAAAARAQKKWQATTAKERSAILRKWYNLILDNQQDLGMLMTVEQGKPLAEACGEVAYGASFIEWYAEEAKRLYGQTIPAPQSDQQIIVLKQPVGVVGAITPWNFPIAMIARKAAPALAAGCSVVLKPSEITPYSALALAALAEESGLPAGLFNVVTGDAQTIGMELTTNALVRKITFTGSTAVGRILMRQSADNIKKLSLELGGNAPFIVFDDADIDAAVDGAMLSKYRNAGQTCVCANRFYIQDGIYDDFAQRLAAKVADLKCGNGLADGTTQGPLIDHKAIEKVGTLVQDALNKGAEAIIGGKGDDHGPLFYQPTVLTNVTADMSLAKEEIFGPVAPLFRFKEDSDVIALANDTEYGLASYFYARDLGRVWQIATALESGIVGINTGIISTEVAPFGGIKQSGLGREGGPQGIEEFLEYKYLNVNY